jgi:hypothetical protein
LSGRCYSSWVEGTCQLYDMVERLLNHSYRWRKREQGFYQTVLSSKNSPLQSWHWDVCRSMDTSAHMNNVYHSHPPNLHNSHCWPLERLLLQLSTIIGFIQVLPPSPICSSDWPFYTTDKLRLPITSHVLPADADHQPPHLSQQLPALVLRLDNHHKWLKSVAVFVIKTARHIQKRWLIWFFGESIQWANTAFFCMRDSQYTAKSLQLIH